MRKVFSRDGGASVTILGLACLVLVLLLSVFIVDFAKILYVKGLYSSFAQKSVQTAVKVQDSIGGLKPESAQRLVDEYLLQRNGGVNSRDTQPFRSSCERAGNYPRFRITYDKGRRRGAQGVSVSADGSGRVSVPDPGGFFRNQYNAVQVEVVDVTDNFFYGVFGVPCTEVRVVASGIAVSSFDEDEIVR